MREIPLLAADDIEVKVKKVTGKGAIALLYKTARTDMDVLDKVFGADNWQCRYDEIKGNLYCTILVKSESGEWVGKMDCGIESRSDGDGNEKKGEASDAFKRAGFRWGIGRELYTSPFVFLSVETVADGQGYKLKNPFARFDVASIDYTDRRITGLTIKDDKGVVVFATGAKPKPKTIVPDSKADPGPECTAPWRKPLLASPPVTRKSMIDEAMAEIGIDTEQFDAIAVRLRGHSNYVDKDIHASKREENPMTKDELVAALNDIKAEYARLMKG